MERPDAITELVAEQLSEEFEGRVEREEIAEVVEAHRGDFVDARVTAFVPTLLARTAREQLGSPTSTSSGLQRAMTGEFVGSDESKGPSPSSHAPDTESDDDEDLISMDRSLLAAEVRRLRAGIRRHRDETGQALCWHQPALWGLLPESAGRSPEVPSWPDFLHGCVRYRQSLESS